MSQFKYMSKADIRARLQQDQDQFLDKGNAIKKCRTGKRKSEKVMGKIIVSDPDGGLKPSKLNVKEMCCGLHKIKAETNDAGPRTPKGGNKYN